MAKTIQWLLFLLIAFGTLIGIFALGARGMQGVVLLFAGLSLSLYVFLFVPFCAKFFLSELLVIFITLGAQMTLMVNVARRYAENGAAIFLCIVVALLVPFILFGILNKRRPKDLRFLDVKQVQPGKPNTIEGRRKKAIRNIILPSCILLFWIPSWCATALTLPVPVVWGWNMLFPAFLVISQMLLLISSILELRKLNRERKALKQVQEF